MKESRITVNAIRIEWPTSGLGGSGDNPDYSCDFIFRGVHKSLMSQLSIKTKNIFIFWQYFSCIIFSKNEHNHAFDKLGGV